MEIQSCNKPGNKDCSSYYNRKKIISEQMNRGDGKTVKTIHLRMRKIQEDFSFLAVHKNK